MKIKSFKPKLKMGITPNLVPTEQAVTEQPVNQINAVELSAKGGKFQGLSLIPLGGVGDVTKNMYVYEYGDDILIIDCGVGFPDEGMLGVDLVIPDISYLQDKKSKIKGLVITHGHEDHIGGLPYLWPELNCPIYTQKFTAGLIRAKFAEHGLPKDQIHVLDINSKIQIGVFNISFYQVSHSVPDATGIILDTPVGKIIHQSDFKIDWTPINGQTTEVAKVALAGQEGVLLMLIDALRSEKKGYNPSERSIQPIFERIVDKSQGKVLITMTSSNMTRIQQAINVASSRGRKIAMVGRSMETNFQVARDLGYIDVPPNLIIAPDEIKRFPDNKLLIIIAGSQGQPDSSLARAANNDHKFVTLKKNDAVIFSADAIPSSESSQSALIDTLVRHGMEVYYSAITDGVHVSGHATAEELKTMLSLAKPRYVLPIGATFKQMKAFSNLALDLGWQENQILLLEDGQSIDVRPQGITMGEKFAVNNVYVDGLGVGDVGNIVLRDRQVLAEEGIVMVVVPIDVSSGRLAGEIDLISRGFVFEKESEGLLEDAKRMVKEDLTREHKGSMDWRFARRHIEELLEKFFYEETQRRPMILPVVVEI